MIKLFYLLTICCILVNAYKESAKDISIVLKNSNFDELVMRSKEIWFVMFSTKDCKHCKKFSGKFKLAANKMKGLVKFGIVDLDNEENGPLARRFNITGIPTVMIFEYGLKMKRKSKAYEYAGKREWKNVVNYATNLYHQSSTERGEIEIHELFRHSKWDRECKDEMYCVVIMLPHISTSNAAERKVYLATLKEIASKNKQKFQQYTWFWMQAGDQPEFEDHFNPEGYPVLIYSKSDKLILYMKEMYTEENFQKFLDSLIISGKANFVQTKYAVNFQTVAKWDGKDWHVHIAKRKEMTQKRKERAKKEKDKRETEEDKKEEEKEKSKKERAERSKKRAEAAKKAASEPDEPEEPDAYDAIKKKAQEDAKKTKKERKVKRPKKAKEEKEEDSSKLNIDEIKKKTELLMKQIQHQMQTYSDKIPKKIKKLIDDDVALLGMTIEKDGNNLALINKLVLKLEKDSMKIGESIYKKFDESEIEKREREAKVMPSDDEVMEGLKGFIKSAEEQIEEFGKKLPKEVVQSVTNLIEKLTNLINEAKPDKSAIEETVKELQTAQMEIGKAIYKQAEEKEKEEKAAKEKAIFSDEEEVEIPKATEEGEQEIGEVEDEEEEDDEEDEDEDEEEEEPSKDSAPSSDEKTKEDL